MTRVENTAEGERTDRDTRREALGRGIPIRLQHPWATPLRATLIVAAVVVGIWLAFLLRDILLLFVVALIFATGLTPPVNRLQRLGLPRVVALLLIFLAFGLVLVGLLFLVIPPAVDALVAFVNQLPSLAGLLVDRYQALRQQAPFLPDLNAQADTFLQDLGGQLADLSRRVFQAAQYVLIVVGALFSAFFIVTITFYLVADGERIQRYVVGFARPDHRDAFRDLLNRTGDRVGGWFLGELALMAVIGVASFIALQLLGVPGAVLLALIAGLTEAIPTIGPYIGAVPAVIVAFVQDPLLALWVIIAYVVIQQLEGNILQPLILGRAVRLHPLAVLAALLVGGTLLGIVGAIFAVPMASAGAVLLGELRHARDHAYQKDRESTNDDSVKPAGS